MIRLLTFICFWILTTSFIKNNNVIEVDITPNERVVVNNEFVELENLCDTLNYLFFNYRVFGKHYPRREDEIDRVVVSFYAYRNVTYGKYIAVSDKIEEAYHHAWNTMAYSKYSRPFEALSKSQKEEIKKRLPKIISEADPVSNKTPFFPTTSQKSKPYSSKT